MIGRRPVLKVLAGGVLGWLVEANASPRSPMEQGRALTTAFYTGDLETVWSGCSDALRQALGSTSKLAEFRRRVQDELGTEQAVVRETLPTLAGRQLYRRIARFSKTAELVVVQWTFGPDGLVQGFTIHPVLHEASSDRLDYVPVVRLRLPFTGPWFVFWGGRTLAMNQHASVVDQRFAYDFLVQREGRLHDGDGRRNEDYYCFDRPILAPASGTVVSVENEVGENVPGVENPAQPLGNHVILSHGNDEFSFLCHFRKGTVTPRNGARVTQSDVLGLCGNSGNSTGPHLHYHLQDTPVPFKGRGLPAPFHDYLADGKLIELGEPVQGQTIEARGSAVRG